MGKWDACVDTSTYFDARSSCFISTTKECARRARVLKNSFSDCIHTQTTGSQTDACASSVRLLGRSKFDVRTRPRGTATTDGRTDGLTRALARVVVAGFRRPDDRDESDSSIGLDSSIGTSRSLLRILDRCALRSDSKSAGAAESVVMDPRDGASSTTTSGLTSRRTKTKTANKRKVMMRRGRKDGLRYARDATNERRS